MRPRRTAAALLGSAALLLLLASSSAAATPRVVIPVREVTPLRPVGAADRAKNGPARLATPPDDAGAADDPDATTAPLENMAAPAVRPAPPR